MKAFHTTASGLLVPALIAGVLTGTLNARALGNAFAIVTCGTTAACNGGANSARGIGVKGTSAGGIGVVGETATGIAGIVGKSPSTIGVYGSSATVGVEGVSLDTRSIRSAAGAVSGIGSGGNGVYGASSGRNGGFFENSSANYFTLYSQNDSAGGYPFEAAGAGGSFYVDPDGNGVFTGTVTAANVTTYVRTRDGRRIGTFAPQGTRASIEDTGTARIVSGSAVVRFDPAFAHSADLDSVYHVFLTPDGDTRGLYVARKLPGGFVVRESQGGHSSLAFDYRVVAQPTGSSGERLPERRSKRFGAAFGHSPQ
jgi:hypothetical protein